MKKRPIQLLLLEDNPGDARLMSEYLRSDETLQYEVKQVSSLAAGLVSLAENTPEVILTDLGLTDSQGLDTFTQLHAAAPHIPIVVLTGLNDAQQAALAVKAGAQDYLNKDEITSSFLRRAVSYAIERKQAVETLQQNEERFRLMFENAPVGYQSLDENGCFLDVNTSFLELLGYTRQEVIGHSFADFLHPDQVTLFQQRFLILTKSREVLQDIEFTLRHRDGSFMEASFTTRLVRDEDGRFLRTHSAFQDISARKQSERAIVLMTETQRQIAGFTSINEVYDLLGNRVQALIGDGYVSVSHLDEVSQIFEVIGFYGLEKKYEKLIKKINIDPLSTLFPIEEMSPEDLRMFRSGRLELYENGIYRLALKKIPKHICSFIEKELKLTAVYIMGFTWDGIHHGSITILVKADIEPYREQIETTVHQATLALQRILSDEAMRKSEAQYRLLAENIQDVIWVMDIKEDRLVYVSPSVTRLRGYTPQEVLATPVSESLSPRSAQQVAAWMSDVFQLSNEPNPMNNFLVEQTCKDGSTIWTEVSASLIRDENGIPFQVLGVSRDISERIRSDQQIRLQAAALQSAANAMVITDRAGSIQWINPAYEQLTGYSLHEAIGLNPRILRSGVQPKEFYKKLWDTILSGQVWHSELVNKRKDGSLYTEEETITPLLDDTGQVSHFIGIKQDISKRKQAEIERQQVEDDLRQSEERFRNILNTIEDGYYEVDLKGSFTFFNPALPKIFKYEADELMGMNYRQYVEPNYKIIIYQAFNQVYQTGLPAHNTEWVVICKDGERIYIEASTSLIKDLEGNLTGFRGIVRDVTQRKQTEENLHRSEAELRALFAALPDVVLVFDKDGRYLKVAESNQDLLYKPMPELIGKTLHDVFPPGEANLFNGYIQKVLNTSNTVQFEYSLRIQDRETWFAATIAPMIENYVIWVARDITENKKAELELQESHSLLQATLESTADGILVVDLQGRITMTNQNFADMWGISRHQLEGQDVSVTRDQILKHLIDPQAFIDKTSEIYADPAAESSDLIEIKDGRILERVTRPQYQAETIVGRVSSFRDITERIQAEKLVLESEAKYRSLFDNVPDGVYRTTPDGKFLAVNRALVSMLGFESEDELKNATAYHMYENKNSREMFLEEINKFGFVKNMELKLRTAQGKYVVGMENARAFRDENGSVLYYEGTLTDITERKQVETERQTLLEIMQGFTSTDDLHEYLQVVHHAIGKVILAKNFFVVLKNKQTGLFELTYLVDEFDQDTSFFEMGKSLSAYVFRSAKPYLFDPGSFDELVAQGLVELIGAYSPSWLGVPLVVSRETIGVMVVQDYESEGQYSEHEVEFLSSISGQVAQAIRRKSAETELEKLFEIEQRRSQRLSDLQILSAELNSLHTEQELLDRLVNKAALLSDSPVCTVMLLDEKTKEVILAAHYGLPGNVPAGLRIPVAQLPGTAQAFKSGKPILVSNIDQDMPAMRKVLVHPDVQAFFAFPLVVDGMVAGAITLSSMQPRKPSAAEIQTYQLLARLTSAALDNVRLFEGVNRSLQRMSSLRRVDMAISASFDLVLTLNILLEQVTANLGVDAADILVFDPTDSTLKYTCGRGFRSQALKYTNLRIGEGFAGQAALERRTIHVPDLQKELTDLERSMSLPSEGFVSYWGVPLVAKGNIQGVLEVFNRQPVQVDQDWISFMETLAGQAAIAVDNVLLFNHLERSNADLSMAYDSTLTGWATALELRDNETEGHTRRVAATATQLAVKMGVRDRDIMYMRWGSLLHDIGKMGIPDSILLKPGPLSDEEWVIMRTHPVLAYEMLSPIDYLGKALEIPYNHHEKWDGTGYPRGLKGEQIPLSARIFAIIDVWDALTSDRPYRQAWSHEKTIKYIQGQVGTHFDPNVAAAFLKMVGSDGKLPGV